MANEVSTITHANATHKKICTLKEELQKNFLELGAYLKLIHDENLYLLLDDSTWQEYLDMPEVDLSRSQAFKLIAVYERWILKYDYTPEEISKISIEKLYIASSQANETNHKEWLEKARVLSRADLKSETPGNTQKPEQITCPHCGRSFDYYR